VRNRLEGMAKTSAAGSSWKRSCSHGLSAAARDLRCFLSSRALLRAIPSFQSPNASRPGASTQNHTTG